MDKNSQNSLSNSNVSNSISDTDQDDDKSNLSDKKPEVIARKQSEIVLIQQKTQPPCTYLNNDYSRAFSSILYAQLNNSDIKDIIKQLVDVKPPENQYQFEPEENKEEDDDILESDSDSNRSSNSSSGFEITDYIKSKLEEKSLT